MSLFPLPLRNPRGMALLYLVLLFTLLGVLLGVGARMLGSSVTQGKVRETKAGLERDVQLITAWAVRNGRLPFTTPTNEYATLFGANPLDAWGGPIAFIYDSNLTALSTGGICGRTGTAISFSGQDVAFLLLSGGDDMSISSTPKENGAFSGALDGLQAADMYRIVTLNELRAQAGCSGATRGDLRIVNNELPNVCKGMNYAVTLFGDGGVPPVAYTFSGLPAGLTHSGANLSGVTTVAKGPNPVTVTATDSQTPTAHAVQRKYILNVISSCSAI